MNIILLILSLIIYLSYGIPNFIFILFSMISSFIAAKFLTKKYGKFVLGLTIFLNIFLLIAIKLIPNNYFSLFTALGISYYTMQVVSYLIDVYRKKYEAENNLFYYSLYVFYIPHLFIGPIIRYDDMKSQILKPKKIEINNLINGGIRIIWGLAKKLIIAGRLAIVTSTISANPEVYNGCFALFAMILYSIELYADFSGGIDIVLGASKMIGINLKENFNSPYYSETIQEFWRRWHISLSSWFKDYVYIPLGGNRCSKIRKSFNVLITFLLSGLWHGVTYILWGLFHGIFVLFGDKYKTKFKFLNRLITFIIVSFLWSFFIWSSSSELAVSMMISVFTKFNILEFSQNILNLGLTIGDYIVLIVSTIILFIFDGNTTKIVEKIKEKSFEYKLSIFCTLSLIVLVFGIYGIGFNVSEFIYSKF